MLGEINFFGFKFYILVFDYKKDEICTSHKFYAIITVYHAILHPFCGNNQYVAFESMQ